MFGWLFWSELRRARRTARMRALDAKAERQRLRASEPGAGEPHIAVPVWLVVVAFIVVGTIFGWAIGWAVFFGLIVLMSVTATPGEL